MDEGVSLTGGSNGGLRAGCKLGLLSHSELTGGAVEERTLRSTRQ